LQGKKGDPKELGKQRNTLAQQIKY
jgi:hypothetical protein